MASTSTVRRALAVVGALALAATLTLANPAPAAAWSGWTEVPGNGFTSSAPAAVQGGNYIFVRGTDDRIYLNRRTGSSSWTGWGELPGDGRAWSGPAAVLTGNAYYVFVRGTDSHVYFNFYSGSSWSGWRLVPNDWTVSDGMTYSAPAALYNSFANRVEVFIRGTDNRIHTSFCYNGGCGTWFRIPSTRTTPSGVAATYASGPSDGYLFARSFDNLLYFDNEQLDRHYDGFSLLPGGGSTYDSPAATRDPVGNLGLYVRGTDDRVYRWSGGSWSVLGTISTPSAPGAAYMASFNQFCVFVRGTNNRVYYNCNPNP